MPRYFSCSPENCLDSLRFTFSNRIETFHRANMYVILLLSNQNLRLYVVSSKRSIKTRLLKRIYRSTRATQRISSVEFLRVLLFILPAGMIIKLNEIEKEEEIYARALIFFSYFLKCNKNEYIKWDLHDGGGGSRSSI